ncbi:MAG: fatty acyl-AMP ligase [Solirubrobacteraceae bacterium]|nr:fatty acyl-AMP ligase [Solirubrobacteraceae bacterium]
MSPHATSRTSEPPTDFVFGEVAFLSEYCDHWEHANADGVCITFIDYLASREGVRDEVTFAEMAVWTRALAARIAERIQPGDRVAIMAPQRTEYVAGFTAALRTNAVGVPLFAPDLPGQADRLAAVTADCLPAVVLTTSDKRQLVEDFLAAQNLADPPEVLEIDAFRTGHEELAASYHAPDDRSLDDIAYLQYTSGSTRTPAGVALSHRNLTINCFQLRDASGLNFGGATLVSWLPLFHDMGLLIGCAVPVLGGVHGIMLDPVAFILKPLRWLQAMNGERNVVTAAPNFAFDYVAKRVKPEQRAELDLSGVTSWVNGAEPILPATLERFNAAFAECGVPSNALRPSYGLAEATVFVATTPLGEDPTILLVDSTELQRGVVSTEVPEGVTPIQLVSCGKPVGQDVAITDPETREQLEEGLVGEVWVNGENVGQGYWGKDDETRALFHARLENPGQLPATGWLRTEDLGTIIDGRLYITGRIKDLIIIDGRNIYPHDIEFTVEEAHEGIAQRRLASFSAPTEHGEALVVVAERYRHSADAGSRLEEIASAAREAVSLDHSVALHDFVLVEPDTISRTSSGKIARKATRTAYLAGTLSRTPTS